MKKNKWVAPLVALGLISGSSLASAADPFYMSRLREGIAAAERGDHGDAVKVLQVACFGLLEEDILPECLIRLGLSQAANGDREGFNGSFRRIVEAEELLGMYSGATIDPGLVAVFSQRVEQLVPKAIRDSTLSFGSEQPENLGQEAGDSTLDPALSSPPPTLSIKNQRRTLQDQQRMAPEDPEWPRRLARFEQGLERPKAALEAALETLKLAPQDSEGSCVAAWGEGQLGRCLSMLSFLPGCNGAELALQIRGVECSVKEQRWSTGQKLLESLPLNERNKPSMVALEEEVKAGLAPAITAEGLSTDSLAGEPVSTQTVNSELELETRSLLEASSESNLASRASDNGDSAAGQSLDLVGLRSELGSAADPSDLTELYERVVKLSEGRSVDRELEFLAAEIAYRASRWNDAVSHFSIAGDPGDGRPGLLFYLAISLYESGDLAGAQITLNRCIGRLSLSPFVERYRIAILGE